MDVVLAAVTWPFCTSTVSYPPPGLRMTNWPCKAPNRKPPSPGPGPKWRKPGGAGAAAPGCSADEDGLGITALTGAAGAGEFVAATAAPPPSRAATATPAMRYGRRDNERRPIGPIGRVECIQPARAGGSS